jgi:hypothetical protein
MSSFSWFALKTGATLVDNQTLLLRFVFLNPGALSFLLS